MVLLLLLDCACGAAVARPGAVVLLLHSSRCSLAAGRPCRCCCCCCRLVLLLARRVRRCRARLRVCEVQLLRQLLHRIEHLRQQHSSTLSQER